MVNKWIDIDVGKGTVEVSENISEGDINSSGIRVEGFSESWKDKMVNAVYYKGKNSVDVMLELNADKDRFTGIVPPQMLTEDGSFKIVIYAVSDEQVDEPYKDVRPAVWVEVKDGIDSAEILPMDKDVGAYLTLLIDLQNKKVSIDEMIERLGDIEAIKTKLEGVEDGAQKNVQANWAETDPNSDAYIGNKPNLPAMEERLREEINLTNDVAVNAEASADANKDALAKHRANGDENRIHLTDDEKVNVGKIPDMENSIGDNRHDIDTLIELKADKEELDKLSEVTSGLGIDLWTVISAELPSIWEAINYNKDIIDEITAPPVTGVPTTLVPNTAYNFGSQHNITLAFPSVANDGDVIYVGFVSRETTNLVVDTTNTYDFELIPEINTGYEIYAKCNTDDGMPRWIVNYSEYTGVY